MRNVLRLCAAPAVHCCRLVQVRRCLRPAFVHRATVRRLLDLVRCACFEMLRALAFHFGLRVHVLFLKRASACV